MTELTNAASSNRTSPLQAMLIEPPLELVEAILAEERFSVKNDQRNTIVAGSTLGVLIGFDNLSEPLSIMVCGGE